MEKIDIRELDRGDLKSFIFFECFGEWAQNNDINDFPSATIQEIEFKVNGVELKFSTAIVLLEKQFDMLVKEKAEELLNLHMLTLTDIVTSKFSELVKEN